MKIKFVKGYAQFKANSVHLVNNRFGAAMLSSGNAKLADEADVLTEVAEEPTEEEKKSSNKPKRKPRKSTQSK